MATPATLPNTPNMVPGNLLPDAHGTGFSQSEGVNEMIADILQAWTKLGIGASTPINQAALVGTGTGSSAWTTSPTLAGTLTAAALTTAGTMTAGAVAISGNGAIVPAPVSGTPAQHGLYSNNVPKAWAYYTSVTTTALIASFNVASVTDNGTGDTTLTIDRDFGSANFAVTVGVDTGAFVGVCTGRTAGTVRILTFTSAAAAVDVATSMVAMGTQ